MTKTEEQIAKDKDAVQKMLGAKGAMEATLRRISLLENALISAKRAVEEMQKCHGDRLAFSVYRDGGYKYINAAEYTRQVINGIDTVL